ncbi:AAA family ATPase [Aeromicrobium wangtongii]|uniref:AAA family ATPase n=1 Tax=Aeromicrobium wangtongii TaxID=2969247 RepID=A0ABY5M5R5_9ACTN|nr:AAA family ATPase [Aeromicrobium wangtongii]UUP12299.1 AAA family ATPase [Aeromicrobium wangtongii]
MRLHRITLTDFRGVESSEVSFEAPGVTVVVGPNEIGKSSIAEALRLVRDYKSSSQHSSIKAIQPTHRDVGPEVSVELSTGPYRLVYTKRWIRKPSTELRILQPRPEQVTGDQAHDRVEQIFAETMDADLWAALQQVQGESLQQANLARVVPLQTALSAMADDETAGAVHEDLLDRIEREYRRYHTATGKPTDVYAGTIKELAERKEAVQAAEAALRAVDDVVDRHARLTRERDRLASRVVQARAEADELAEREDALAGLRREHEAASDRLGQAEIAVATAQAAVDARAERVVEQQQRSKLAASAEQEWQRAEAEHAEAVARLAEHDAARQSATDEVGDLRNQVIAAEQVVRAVQASEEAERVAERLAGIEAATRRLELAEAALADNPVDDEIVEQIADVQSRLHAERDAAAAGAARVLVERLGEAAVEVDGTPIDAGAARDLTDTATIEVAGVVRVVVTPDDGAVKRRRKIEDREHQLAGLLAELGVADLAEARRRSADRDEAQRLAQAATVERDTLLAGDSVEAVRARLAAIQAHAADASPDVSLVEARATLADLTEQLEIAQGAATASLEQRERILTQVNAANERRLTTQTRAAGATAELERAVTRLASDREVQSDDALTAALVAAEQRRVDDAAALEATRSALAEHDADSLEILAANARELAKRLVDDLARHDADLAAATTELEVRGRDGLRDKLDVALARLGDTQRVHDSLASRARAAQLLRSTMRTHRDAAQQRYVAPFRQAVESLGAIVFGPDFSVEIGDDLSIRSRTSQGVTVPFESLSGGAKEQLALIGRLATAQLVSAEDGAPVILDDSLGFTDADRRRKLAAVINRVGSTSQIIILTCEPDRFADIGSARTVRLG